MIRITRTGRGFTLTQEQVRELLPYLQRFADTGELSE